MTCLAPDLYHLAPEKFGNKTNGISQRRWLLQANPLLAKLVCSAIGNRWITDLERLFGSIGSATPYCRAWRQQDESHRFCAGIEHQI